MQIIIQNKLKNDSKMAKFLRENSSWYKELNRNSQNYKIFENSMKELYKLKPADKINDFIDNIDLVSTILDALN